MRVIVVGGGIVGLTTAHALQESGHEVVLVEANKGVGEGTSFANGAQLSYSYVSPFASAEHFTGLPKLFFSSHSPVRIRLQADPAQWRWLLAFAGACLPGRSLQSTLRLLELAALSREEMQAFEAASRMDFSHRRTGKLVIYSSRRTFTAALLRLDAAWRHNAMGAFEGWHPTVLTPTDCVKLDPFLERIRSRIYGAILSPSDETADCYAFCRALQHHIARPDAKGFVQLDRWIENIEVRSGPKVVATGPRGRVEGDALVLANGIGAQRLATSMGLALPIYPLKGYSITVRMPAESAPLTLSVTDFERRTVFAPLANRLRLAGIADLVGHDLTVDPERLAQLIEYAQGLTGRDIPATEAEPWAGLRPATPHGLPIVGSTSIPGIYVNAGHGGFGFTLAMGCARLLQRALSGETTGFELH